MNVWKLTAAKKLQKTEAPLPEAGDGKIRVRVAKVLLGYLDAALYHGAFRTKYPIIPGRHAVGFVTEGSNPLYPKGTRVLLHAFRPVPEDTTEKRDFALDDFYALGQTADGFLSDFVLVSPDDFTPLPVSVSDERGLLLHHVAAAKEICDRLGAQKGQHIAVVGADLMGILICQLLIYQQAAPILVDANESRLAFARTCGVYYTVPADGKLVSTVASVTGGRLAAGAVYTTTATGNDPEIPFSLCARGGKVVYFGAYAGKVEVSLELAFRKHLSVHCVSQGVKYLTTAINLMANKAIDPAPFHAVTHRPEKIETLLATYFERPDRDVDEINVIDLLR